MARSFRPSDMRPDPRRDVSDEIAFHLEMRTREYLDKGLSNDDARRAAIASFGDVAAVESECRDERGQSVQERARRDWRRGLAMDLSFALRTLRKNVGFTVAATLTLGLGIGITATVFTIVHGVLLRPLPYADAERLEMVWMTALQQQGQLPLSAPNYIDIRDETRTLQSLGAFRSSPSTLGDGAEPEHLAGVAATRAMFDALGVHAIVGRVFTAEEAVTGAPPVAVLSYSLWQRHYGGDRSVVGRQITLGGKRVTVIGVMPQGFAFPRGAELPSGLQIPARTELWTPLIFDSSALGSRGTLNLAAVGRRRAGIGETSVKQELGAMAARLATRYPNSNTGLGLTVISLKDQAAEPVRRELLILMSAVVFVLLIACANVANLLLARTAQRARELAVRAALGAGAGRIARQLVTENIVLALGGAALGVVLAIFGARALLALVPGSLPRADDVAIDRTVLAVTIATAAMVGIVFGLVTALHARRASVAETLRGSTRSTGGTSRATGRRLLVAAEIALSVMLLIGAGLLGSSFVRLERVHPGFDPAHSVAADVLLPIGPRFNPARDGPTWSRFFTELMGRLSAAPGVQAAGAVSSLPLSGAFESGGFAIEGRPRPPVGQGLGAQYSVIAGDYFGAMGIRLLAGRAFDIRDQGDSASVPVVIVSQAFATKHFPGENALGKRLQSGFDFTSSTREIVGIVGDVHQLALGEAALPMMYVPETQMPYPFLTIVVRASGDALGAVPGERAALKALDPTIALDKVRRIDDLVADSLARQRFNLLLLAVFAASALALALVGLYGVIALSVAQRRREIGVRLALGAQARDVLRLVLLEGARVSAVGIFAGLAGALAVSRLIRALLFDVSSTDVMVYGVAAVVVAAVAMVATFAPARRATKVAPMDALRLE